MEPRERTAVIMAAIAVAAVLPRVWLLSSTLESGLFADMVDYHARARHLVDHGTLYPDAFRVPAYPIAMAGALAAFGPSLLSVRILQCVILTLIAVATYVLARGMMSERRAIVAGLIVAWYPGLVLYTVYAMAEPLFTLLLMLALIVAVRSPTALGAITMGVLAGLATLTRQAGVTIVAALGVWAAARPMLERGYRAGLARGVALGMLVAVGTALVIGPWAGRNMFVFKRFVPLETTGGITFLMANYEDATGRYLLSDWETIMQRYLGKEPEEFSRSAAGYRIGIDKITSEPLRIAALVPRRLGYLFDLEGREHLWLYTSGYFGPRSSFVVSAFGWALLLSFPLLVIAAIVALALGPRPQTLTEWAVLWVFAVMLLQHLTVFGDPRFHLPFVPPLAVVALRPWGSKAREGDEGAEGAKGSKVDWWRIGPAAVILLALLIWWAPRFPRQVELLQRAAAPGGSKLQLPY